MKKLIILFFLLTFLTSCKKESENFEALCTDELGCILIRPEEPIKIGVIQDLTGGANTFGNIQYRAIDLAIDQRGRTFLGHPIEVVLEDEGCTAEGGKNSALRVVSTKGVIGVLGTTCSGAATTASKIVSDAGLVMISGSNSAASLTSTGTIKGDQWQEGYFRTATNDSYRVSSAAQFAYLELGVREVVTIDDGDPFTRGAVDIFSNELISLGGEVLFTGRVDKGDENMNPLLQTIAIYKPQMIYIPLFAPEGISIINHLRTIKGLEEVLIMTSSSMIVDDFLNNLEEGDPLIYYVGSVTPEGEGLEEVVNRYKEKYGQEPTGSFSAGYDALNILLDSIERVAVISKNGEILIPKKELRREIRGLKNFNGITGRLTSTEFGDLGLNKFNIYMIEIKSNNEVKRSVVNVFKKDN